MTPSHMIILTNKTSHQHKLCSPTQKPKPLYVNFIIKSNFCMLKFSISLEKGDFLTYMLIEPSNIYSVFITQSKQTSYGRAYYNGQSVFVKK